MALKITNVLPVHNTATDTLLRTLLLPILDIVNAWRIHSHSLIMHSLLEISAFKNNVYFAIHLAELAMVRRNVILV
jgi:hypothetical protein